MKSNIVKKAILSALVSAASCALAANHQESSGSMQKFYVGANIGYLHTPWKDIVGTPQSAPALNDWKNGNGGLGFGANLGYMFQPWVGIEGGWIHVPTVKVTVVPQGVPAPLPESEIKNNAFFTAIKLQHSLGATNLSLYTKVGLGYQDIEVKNGGVMIKNTNPIGVYGAIGVDYSVTQNILIGGSVSFLNGYTKHDKNQFATDLSYFNVGVSYLF